MPLSRYNLPEEKKEVEEEVDLTDEISQNDGTASEDEE